MPRLLFARVIGDIQCLRRRHASKGKVPDEQKRKGLERACEPLLRFKAKPLSPKPSEKFKCQI